MYRRGGCGLVGLLGVELPLQRLDGVPGPMEKVAEVLYDAEALLGSPHPFKVDEGEVVGILWLAIHPWAGNRKGSPCTCIVGRCWAGLLCRLPLESMGGGQCRVGAAEVGGR